MSENETPTPPQEDASETQNGTPQGGASENRGLMIALSYLWLLALVPLLVEKEDGEVQWHAKHGLVLLVAEVILFIVLSILTTLPVLNIVGCFVGPVLWLVVIVIHILCIVKGIGGERFLIPGISKYADSF